MYTHIYIYNTIYNYNINVKKPRLDFIAGFRKRKTRKKFGCFCRRDLYTYILNIYLIYYYVI